MRRVNNQSGFTLIELLLASAILGFLLMFVTAGIVQISRAYNKGLTVKRVQQDARTVMMEMAKAIASASSSGDSALLTEFVPDAPVGDSTYWTGFCVGDRARFVWKTYYDPLLEEGRLDGGKIDPYAEFAVLKDTDFNGACDVSTTNQLQGEVVELLDPKVSVHDISWQKISPRSYQITVTLKANQPDLVSGDACIVGPGDQYCDFATLTTVVSTRN